MAVTCFGASVALSNLTDATTAHSAVEKIVPTGKATTLVDEEYVAGSCSVTTISMDRSEAPVEQWICCIGVKGLSFTDV